MPPASRRRRAAVGAACLLLAAAAAHARSVPAWEPLSAGPVTTWTASLTPKGRLHVQPFLWFERVRGRFDGSGRYAPLPAGEARSFMQQQLLLQYGLPSRLEVSAQLTWQENFVRAGGAYAKAGGAADTFLFARARLLEETEARPGLAGFFQLRVPTGKYHGTDPAKLGADLLGTGSWDLGLGVNASKRLRPFYVHADAYATFPTPARVDGARTTYAPYLNDNLAAELFLGKGFNLMAEMNGFTQGDSKRGGVRVPGTLTRTLTTVAGVGWSTRRVQTLLGWQRTWLGAHADALDGVVLTVILPFGAG